MNMLEYIKTLLKFWEYRRGPYTKRLIGHIKKIYGDKPVYLLGNARSAEYLFLKSLNLPKDSNVIIQSFTCNAVPNPVLWLDLEIRYVDIDRENFNASIEDVIKRSDEKTKVIILQHTFGIEGNTDEILKFAKANDIYVLEDCAHSLGNASLGGKSDAAIISFGIEKVLQTRVGGALILNNSKLIKAFESEYAKIPVMGFLETFVWLLNPLFWRILRFLGALQFPSAKFLRRIKLLNMGFEDPELLGRKPKNYPRKLSNALASVAAASMETLSQNISNRKEVVGMYEKYLGQRYGEVALVRYPYVVKDLITANEIEKALGKKGYRIGDWYRPVIYPSSTNIASMKYVLGSCPIAEDVSKRIVNLPTGAGITRADVEMICNVVLNSNK